jgi:hypothetical protein
LSLTVISAVLHLPMCPNRRLNVYSK